MGNEEVGRLQAAVARLEGMFEAIERRLGGIESKMVSSDVLDQIVTRLLDRIAVDTIKPGCQGVFEKLEYRIKDVERSLQSLTVRVAVLSASIAILVQVGLKMLGR